MPSRPNTKGRPSLSRDATRPSSKDESNARSSTAGSVGGFEQEEENWNAPWGENKSERTIADDIPSNSSAFDGDAGDSVNSSTSQRPAKKLAPASSQKSKQAAGALPTISRPGANGTKVEYAMTGNGWTRVEKPELADTDNKTEASEDVSAHENGLITTQSQPEVATKTPAKPTAKKAPAKQKLRKFIKLEAKNVNPNSLTRVAMTEQAEELFADHLLSKHQSGRPMTTVNGLFKVYGNLAFPIVKESTFGGIRPSTVARLLGSQTARKHGDFGPTEIKMAKAKLSSNAVNGGLSYRKLVSERIDKEKALLNSRVRDVNSLEKLNSKLSVEIEVLRRTTGSKHSDKDFDELAAINDIMITENKGLKQKVVDLEHSNEGLSQANAEAANANAELSKKCEAHLDLIEVLENNKKELSKMAMVLEDERDAVVKRENTYIEQRNEAEFKAEKLEEKIKALEETQVQLEASRQEIEQQLVVSHGNVETLKKAKRDLGKQKVMLKLEGNKLKKEIERLNQQVAFLEQKVQMYLKELQTQKTATAEVHEVLEKTEQEFKEFRDTTELKEKNSSSRIMKLTTSLGQANDKVQRSERQIFKMHEEHAEHYKIVAGLKKTIEDLKQDLEDAAVREADLKTRLSESQERAATFEKKWKKSEKNHKTKMAEAKAERKKLGAELSSTLEELTALKAEHAKCAPVIEDLHKELADVMEARAFDNKTLSTKIEELEENIKHLKLTTRHHIKIIRQLRTKRKEAIAVHKHLKQQLDQLTETHNGCAHLQDEMLALELANSKLLAQANELPVLAKKMETYQDQAAETKYKLKKVQRELTEHKDLVFRLSEQLNKSNDIVADLKVNSAKLAAAPAKPAKKEDDDDDDDDDHATGSSNKVLLRQKKALEDKLELSTTDLKSLEESYDNVVADLLHKKEEMRRLELMLSEKTVSQTIVKELSKVKSTLKAKELLLEERTIELEKFRKEHYLAEMRRQEKGQPEPATFSSDFYDAVADKLEGITLSELRLKYARLESELDREQAECKAFRAQGQEHMTNYHKIETRFQQLEERYLKSITSVSDASVIQDKLDLQVQSYAKLEGQHKRLSDKYHNIHKAHVDIQGERDKLQAELLGLKKDMKDDTQKFNRLNMENRKLKQQVRLAEQSQSQMDSLKDEYDEKDAELARLKHEVKAKEELYQTSQKRIESLQNDKKTLQTSVEFMEGQLNRKRGAGKKAAASIPAAADSTKQSTAVEAVQNPSKQTSGAQEKALDPEDHLSTDDEHDDLDLDLEHDDLSDHDVEHDAD